MKQFIEDSWSIIDEGIGAPSLMFWSGGTDFGDYRTEEIGVFLVQDGLLELMSDEAAL